MSSAYYMNEAADARRDYVQARTRSKPRSENEILEVSGKVISAPETGMNAHGKKSCTYEVQSEEGRVFKIYTVRFYDEAVNLSVGEDITVKYIQDGKFNNQVGSIVHSGDGSDMVNLAASVKRLENKVDVLMDRQDKTLSKVSAIQQKLDYLASEAEMYSAEMK